MLFERSALSRQADELIRRELAHQPSGIAARMLQLVEKNGLGIFG